MAPIQVELEVDGTSEPLPPVATLGFKGHQIDLNFKFKFSSMLQLEVQVEVKNIGDEDCGNQ